MREDMRDQHLAGPISAMDLKVLGDFLCLAEVRNFRRAAELRHVTRPGLSRRIQSLEAWVGARLVDRDAMPLTLTPAGEEIRIMAEEILAYLERKQADGTVSFGPGLFPEGLPARASRHLLSPLRGAQAKGAAAAATEQAFAPIDELLPTVGIRRFHNVSRSDGDEGLCAALTDLLLHDLSQSFLLTARPDRNGRPDFIVEGSLISDASTAQATLQVVHGASGRSLLSKKYRFDLDQLACRLDEIAADFACAIMSRIRALLLADASRKPAETRDNLQNYVFAHETAVRGFLRDLGPVREAITLLDAREPNRSRIGHLEAMLAFIEYFLGENDVEMLDTSWKHFDLALDHDPDFYPVRMGRALTACLRGDLGQARSDLDILRGHGPADPMNYAFFGIVETSLGRYAEAIEALETSVRLETAALSFAPFYAGLAHYLAGNHAQAAAAIDLRRVPLPEAMALKLAAYAEGGLGDRMTMLRAAHKYLLPSRLKKVSMHRLLLADPEAQARVRRGLEKAGISDISAAAATAP